MSRYTKQAVDKVIVYGTDHALGYFFEEWLKPEFDKEDGTPFSDRCQMFGMNKEELLDKLHTYRCKREHIEAVEQGIEF